MSQACGRMSIFHALELDVGRNANVPRHHKHELCNLEVVSDCNIVGPHIQALYQGLIINYLHTCTVGDSGAP